MTWHTVTYEDILIKKYSETKKCTDPDNSQNNLPITTPLLPRPSCIAPRNEKYAREGVLTHKKYLALATKNAPVISLSEASSLRESFLRFRLRALRIRYSGR